MYKRMHSHVTCEPSYQTRWMLMNIELTSFKLRSTTQARNNYLVPKWLDAFLDSLSRDISLFNHLHSGTKQMQIKIQHFNYSLAKTITS